MNKVILIILLSALAVSCADPEPRKPITQKSHSFIKESIARNKKLVLAEEAELLKAIERDGVDAILNKEFGFWYAYVKKDSTTTYTPKKEDEIAFTYNIQTLNNSVILSEEENGMIRYKVDQTNQELIPGLRRGVKLMREGETITFYLPSHLAYGYYGIPDKLGSNYPIKSTVTLQKIISKN